MEAIASKEDPRAASGNTWVFNNPKGFPGAVKRASFFSKNLRQDCLLIVLQPVYAAVRFFGFNRNCHSFVIPDLIGDPDLKLSFWIPAFAGMTG